MGSMAKIVQNDNAPAKGEVRYNVGGVEFTLGGNRKGFETDDLTLLREAQDHPWLDVDASEKDAVPTPAPNSPAAAETTDKKGKDN